MALRKNINSLKMLTNAEKVRNGILGNSEGLMLGNAARS